MAAGLIRAGLALLLLAFATPPATSAGLDESDMAARLLARVNHHRARHDLMPLTPDGRLGAAAQAHAADMAAGDFFSHTGSDGSEAPERLARSGYRYRLVAENIAGGLVGPEATVDAWMASEGHRRNILLVAAREAGVGHVYLGDDRGAVRLGHYWTLTIGARR